MKKLFSLLFSFAVISAFAETSEIKVDLAMDNLDYVSGERIRAVIDVANSSPDTIRVGYPDSKDRLFVDVYRSNDKTQLDRFSSGKFVSAFRLEANEGQKLEVFLGDHYGLREPGRYLAKPVLVHKGVRYEGSVRAFGIVPGMKVASALQMFKNVEGLRREFELRIWSRKNKEHLFLIAEDGGTGSHKWVTTDLGIVMRINKPTVTVLETGEVVVLQRYDRDHFLRSEFWSLPEAFEFHDRELMMDPEVAGSERVKELYKENGVKPKPNPWWKFW